MSRVKGNDPSDRELAQSIEENRQISFDYELNFINLFVHNILSGKIVVYQGFQVNKLYLKTKDDL